MEMFIRGWLLSSHPSSAGSEDGGLGAELGYWSVVVERVKEGLRFERFGKLLLCGL